MTALTSVLQILQEAGKPLHYREITKRIMAKGLWLTEGKTPEQLVLLLSEHEIGVPRRSHEMLELANTNLALAKGAG